MADETIPLDMSLRDVRDEHFHAMSDVKNVPLKSTPNDFKEGKNKVLNEDQAELNAAAAPVISMESLQQEFERDVRKEIGTSEVEVGTISYEADRLAAKEAEKTRTITVPTDVTNTDRKVRFWAAKQG